MSKKRAQIFTVDIALSLSLLLFLLSLSLLISDIIYDEINLLDARTELLEATATASDHLLKAPGYPANWSTESNLSLINSIGLASTRGVLDYQKVDAFFQFANSTGNYTQLKKILGLDRQSYNFTLNISYSNGTVYNITSSLPSSNITASSERLALLNGSVMRVQLITWIGGP